MKKKAGMEREKKESETNGDDVRGGRDRKEGEEERRGEKRKGEERKGEGKRQRVFEEYRSRGWSRKRKIVKSQGWLGVLDEGISTEIWILDSMGHRLSRKEGIWTRCRQGGSRRDAETEEWIEGAVESLNERIKARDRLVRPG